MLAYSGQSEVVLLNPSRLSNVAETTGGEEETTTGPFVPSGAELSYVGRVSIEPRRLRAAGTIRDSAGCLPSLPVDGLLLWNDQSFVERLGRSGPASC